jgi:DNA-binding response OmpR family regulator
LKLAGLHVVVAYDGPAALKQLEVAQPSVIVMETNLATSDGLELLREFRRRSTVPIIILSARDGEQDKILGLDLGADDYVSKPFQLGELSARVRAQLRRMSEGWSVRPSNGLLHVGPLTLNTAEYVALKHGQRLPLTVTEYRLLHYLMINAGNVVTSRAIGKDVWGYEDTSTNEIVRVTVYRLRRKIEDDPLKPQLLKTVPGVGVILREPE